MREVIKLSRANPFYESIKNYEESVANLTGLDKDVVKLVLDGLNKSIVQEVYEQGIDNESIGELTTKWIRVDIPGAGTAWLLPVNRDKSNTDDYSNYTFKCHFNIDKKLLSKFKTAYFDHESELTDHVENRFKELLPSNLKSLL